MREIAARADMNPALAHRYFGSKQNLMRAAMEQSQHAIAAQPLADDRRAPRPGPALPGHCGREGVRRRPGARLARRRAARVPGRLPNHGRPRRARRGRAAQRAGRPPRPPRRGRLPGELADPRLRPLRRVRAAGRRPGRPAERKELDAAIQAVLREIAGLAFSGGDGMSDDERRAPRRRRASGRRPCVPAVKAWVTLPGRVAQGPCRRRGGRGAGSGGQRPRRHGSVGARRGEPRARAVRELRGADLRRADVEHPPHGHHDHERGGAGGGLGAAELQRRGAGAGASSSSPCWPGC